MRFRSRKFLLAVGVLVAGTVGLFVGTVDAANYTALASIVLGLYAGGNVAAKAVDKRSVEP